MSVDYKWANAVMGQLKGCQAEIARLREEAAAMTTAIQKVQHLEAEIASLRLADAEREALYWFTGGRGPVCPQHLATIRNLMARLS